MTRIKYATIARIPEEEQVVIRRGKKNGTTDALQLREDGDGHDAITFVAEKVVELPDEMSPSEYEDHMQGDLDDLPEDHVRHRALELEAEIYGNITERGGDEA